MPPPPIHVLVADDHLVVRLGLATVLQFDAGIRVVAMAESGQEALSLYRKHRPDVVPMDLRMPDLDGVEATRRIRSEFPEARILMLTTYDADEDVRRALDAGASGYLLKTAGQEELVATLRAVHSVSSPIGARTWGTSGADKAKGGQRSPGESQPGTPPGRRNAKVGPPEGSDRRKPEQQTLKMTTQHLRPKRL